MQRIFYTSKLGCSENKCFTVKTLKLSKEDVLVRSRWR